MAEACFVFVALLAVAPVPTSGATSPAVPSDSPSLRFPTRATVDGKLAHYLRSPFGEIDGVVLDGGAVAIFPPGRHVVVLQIRKGDSVRVSGDVIGGFHGPILLRASVEPEPDLYSGMALRPPHDWPEGLPAVWFSAVMDGNLAEGLTSPLPSSGTTATPDDLLFARHPRLQQRTAATRTTQWLKRLTSGGNRESSGFFNRRREDDGP